MADRRSRRRLSVTMAGMCCDRPSAVLIVVSLALAGCSQSPTSPTPTSGVAPSASGSQIMVAIPPGLTITPPRALGATRFVAFGDSITWGASSAWYSAGDVAVYVAAANGGYAERLQASLTLGHPPQTFTMFNEGLPGELAVNALTRFRTMLTTRRPHAVLLLEGINDLSNDISVSRTVGGLRSMLDAAAAVGVPVLLATMYQTYAETSPEGSYRENGAPYVAAFNVAVRQLATGRPNVHLVDLEPAMANRNLVGADGVHLEDAGFDVMAARFQAVIEAAFPVRGSFQ
jgi:lysophospholipase L1-like esterase